MDYATSDGEGDGGATAGSDYAAASGTLSFAVGDTEKTVAVEVLDDAVDEDSETFTLTLSNVQGNAYLADAEATGTITNSDPMPRAWLARFGRAAATHVLEAVEERLESGGGGAGSWVRLGGHQVGGMAPEEREALERLRLAPPGSLWEETRAAQAAEQEMTLEQLLLGSAFQLASDAEDGGGGGRSGPRLSAWGRASASGFEGSEGTMTLSGTVTTATLGVDGSRGRWLTGVAVAYSEGEGSFAQPETPGGEVWSALTSVHPYVGYGLSERVRLWGVAGYGAGSLELRMGGGAALRTDLDLSMGAFGVRGVVAETAGGLEAALRSDVLWVRTGSKATAGLAAASAETSRVRLVLEGSRPVALAGGGVLTPTLELGVRRDGGDAEEGSGVEAGGRLAYATPWGLSVELSVRGLLAHESSSYEEWGASAALRYTAGESGTGLTASLLPSWGASSGGVGRLWSPADARGLVGGGALEASAAGQVAAELGYGLRTGRRGGLLTPYVRASLVEGRERSWQLGTRLSLAERLDLSLEASQRQGIDGRASQDVALRASVPF